MKTIQIKRIITLTSILIILLFSNPLFSQGFPADGSDDVNDEVATPIDNDIWMGLIGGCLISAYFITRKQKNSYNN